MASIWRVQSVQKTRKCEFAYMELIANLVNPSRSEIVDIQKFFPSWNRGCRKICVCVSMRLCVRASLQKSAITFEGDNGSLPNFQECPNSLQVIF